MGKGNSQRRRMAEREKDELNKKIGNMVLAEAFLNSEDLEKFKADLRKIEIGRHIDVVEEKCRGDKFKVKLKVNNSSKVIAVTAFYWLKSSLLNGVLMMDRWDKRFELADIILPEEYVFK